MGDKLHRFILGLRKIGILRYGIKSYKFNSAKGMPAQAILDDVYDEEKDLVSKCHFIKKKDLKTMGSPVEHSNYCTRCEEKLTNKEYRCAYNDNPPKK